METKKHQIIYNYLEGGIRSGKFQPGTQLPTDLQIVEEFGVSRPTVARAMRDLQQLGLIDRRAGVGSYVREQNKELHHATVGLLIPELGHSDFLEPICAQIARDTHHHNLSLLWADSGVSEQSASHGLGRLDVSVERVYRSCKKLVERGVSGVFYTPMFGNTAEPGVDERILTHLTKAGIGIVLLDRDYKVFPEQSGYDVVSVDHLTGQLWVTENLIEAGFSKFTYLQWAGTTDSLEQRISGCRIALNRAGLPCSDLSIIKGDPRNKEFVADLVRLSAGHAVMCENDMIATHLMESLVELKVSVPDDVVVFGFNDNKFAQHLGIPLSTVRQPCNDIGKVAVQVMADRIADPSCPARKVLLQPKLIIRQSSTRALKKGRNKK